MVALVLAIVAIVFLAILHAYAHAEIRTLCRLVGHLTDIAKLHEEGLEAHANQIPMLSSPERAREIFEENDRLRTVVRKATS